MSWLQLSLVMLTSAPSCWPINHHLMSQPHLNSFVTDPQIHTFGLLYSHWLVTFLLNMVTSSILHVNMYKQPFNFTSIHHHPTIFSHYLLSPLPTSFWVYYQEYC